MILIYITCKDKKEAEKISSALLKKRLIACANIFPIQSMYSWKGKIEKSKETALLCKTQEGKYIAAERAIKSMHSYDIPCIIRIKADANERYDNWIKRETLGV